MPMDPFNHKIEGRQPINKRRASWKCSSVMGNNESFPDSSINNCDTSSMCTEKTKSLSDQMNAILRKTDDSADGADCINKKNREIQNLKDLLLLNLDLIQQQHDIINAKEQKINALGIEKDAVSRLFINFLSSNQSINDVGEL